MMDQHCEYLLVADLMIFKKITAFFKEINLIPINYKYIKLKN
jgi:hypothetical protein